MANGHQIPVAFEFSIATQRTSHATAIMMSRKRAPSISQTRRYDAQTGGGQFAKAIPST
jgi:hypothetical protein